MELEAQALAALSHPSTTQRRVSPDGKRFLVPTPLGGSQPLEVVLNWAALLKQGSATE